MLLSLFETFIWAYMGLFRLNILNILGLIKNIKNKTKHISSAFSFLNFCFVLFEI